MTLEGAKRRTWILLGVVAALAALAGAASLRKRDEPSPAPHGPPAAVTPSAPLSADERHHRRVGGLDVTFLVFSDTHFGFESAEHDPSGVVHDPVKSLSGVEVINAEAIGDMNSIATKAWPKELGGVIGRPRGLLISGDLTEDGEPWQWSHFLAFYGLRGGDALLGVPVFEGHGNHDKFRSWYVLDRVRERHGGVVYSFDWDDLHFVCLGEAPDDTALEWLAKDIAAVGRERPVVVYQHFPLLGPWSDNNWFGEGDYRGRLHRTLADANVVAFFHGHYHASGRYRWHERDVYNVGAAKHGHHSFAVVHIDDRRLRVASWQFVQDRWEWWHEKPLRGAAGPTIEGGRHAYSDGVK